MTIEPICKFKFHDGLDRLTDSYRDESIIIKLGVSTVIGYVLASLIHHQQSGGWASSKKKEEDIKKQEQKQIRVAKGIGTCICRNNV